MVLRRRFTKPKVLSKEFSVIAGPLSKDKVLR
jgi:hypothetical protein